MTTTNTTNNTDNTKMMLNTLSEKIIRNFDFQKVLNYMTDVNWKWTKVDENDNLVQAVPTLDELKNCVRDMFDDVITNNDTRYSLSTGGFSVEKNLKATPAKKLKLKFKFEERVNIGNVEYIAEMELESYPDLGDVMKLSTDKQRYMN